jgi:hypothetical protein
MISPSPRNTLARHEQTPGDAASLDAWESGRKGRVVPRLRYAASAKVDLNSIALYIAEKAVASRRGARAFLCNLSHVPAAPESRCRSIQTARCETSRGEKKSCLPTA